MRFACTWSFARRSCRRPATRPAATAASISSGGTKCRFSIRSAWMARSTKPASLYRQTPPDLNMALAAAHLADLRHLVHAAAICRRRQDQDGQRPDHACCTTACRFTGIARSPRRPAAASRKGREPLPIQLARSRQPGHVSQYLDRADRQPSLLRRQHQLLRSLPARHSAVSSAAMWVVKKRSCASVGPFGKFWTSMRGKVVCIETQRREGSQRVQRRGSKWISSSACFSILALRTMNVEFAARVSWRVLLLQLFGRPCRLRFCS